MQDYRTEFVPADRVTPRLEAQWRDLADRAVEPNPYMEPDLVVPAMAHMRAGDSPGLLTVTAGDRLDACWTVNWPVRLPLPHGPRLPLPLLHAWIDRFPALGTPLVDAERTLDAVAALLDPPQELRRRAPAVLARFFADDGPVAAAVDAVLAGRGHRAFRWKTYERAVLRGDRTPAPNKNTRRRYRRLAQDRETMAAELGPVVLRDRSGDFSVREEFLRLEASGWKGAAGTAVACRPGETAWFHEVCERLALAGRLEILSLEAAGRPVAMKVHWLAGDQAFGYKSAYDETVGSHRPGMQLLAELVADPQWNRELRDSCTKPDNELFNGLWPGRRRLSTVVLPFPGRAGRATVKGLEMAAAGRRRQQARRAAGEGGSTQPG